MRNLFQERRFQLSFIAPSILWVLICIIYISVFVGWGNLFDFLPHEFAAIILSIVTPIFLFGVLFIVFRMSANEDQISDEIHRHRTSIEDLSAKVEQIVEAMRENWQFNVNDIDALKRIPEDLTGAIEALKAIPGDMTSAMKTHNAGIEDITNRLADVLRKEEEKSAKIDVGDITRHAALMGLINMVLNDISVTVTRMLVRLLEYDGRTREEIKEFVQGLVNAYSAGDKDAFFHAFHFWLVGKPERIEALRSMIGESPEVSVDLSKILREIEEIITLVERCDEHDIAKIVFDDNALRKLSEVLKPHFNLEGRPRELPQAADDADAEEEEEHTDYG